MSKLKPCPFCGEMPRVVSFGRSIKYYEVRCENKECILVYTELKDTPEEAIDRWNRRADDGKC